MSEPELDEETLREMLKTYPEIMNKLMVALVDLFEATQWMNAQIEVIMERETGSEWEIPVATALKRQEIIDKKEPGNDL